MKKINHGAPSPAAPGNRRRRKLVLATVGVGLVLLIFFLIARRAKTPADFTVPERASQTAPNPKNKAYSSPKLSRRPAGDEGAAAKTAEENVAEKVRRFGQSRHQLVRDISRKTGKPIPDEVEKFFDALEGGDWDEIEVNWKDLAKRSGQYENSSGPAPELNPYWMAVLDAYGVAEQAHDWPAQKLLDYGNRILESLRPGMVYVGGTDSGRWIPELLNETSGGDPHIMITQNAFADGRYIEYMNTLFGGQMSTLTSEDSQRAFQEYVADAQRRYEHDRQFPDEPKQVRAGENVRMEDGRFQVTGQMAVMGINERLLQMLMTKNPELDFALQESFPFRGTYADALPLGPLMELGARDGQNTLTPERASQSLDYWRDTAQQLLDSPDAMASAAARGSYSHDVAAAANLLAAHNFVTEAEQAYRLAVQFTPDNPERVGALAEVLRRSGRADEAGRMLDEFARQYPQKQAELDRLRASTTLIVGGAQTQNR